MARKTNSSGRRDLLTSLRKTGNQQESWRKRQRSRVGAMCAKFKGRNHFASKCEKVNNLREESEESEDSDV